MKLTIRQSQDSKNLATKISLFILPTKKKYIYIYEMSLMSQNPLTFRELIEIKLTLLQFNDRLINERTSIGQLISSRIFA